MNKVDFSKLYHDFAIFIPAISEMYARYVGETKVKRELPLPLTRKDLDFFDPNTRIFYLPKALYSAGQVVGSDAGLYTVDMVTGRDKSLPTTIVGDSGGFQIETGTIKWEGDKTKARILKWLEMNCDWSMILDFPTGSINRRGNTYYTEYAFDKNGLPVYDETPVIDQNGNPVLDKKGQPKVKKTQQIIKHELDFWFCLDRTVENNHYFVEHRTPNATKFLNVLQGRMHDLNIDEKFVEECDFANLPRAEQKKLLDEGKISEVDAWYQCVKQFSTDYGDKSFEGWSLAGWHKEDFALTLRRIVILLHDGMLKDKKWLHFLGMGKLRNGCVYTSIQRMVREHEKGNPDFTISYDVSSPFTAAAYGKVMYGSTMDNVNWATLIGTSDGRVFIGHQRWTVARAEAEFELNELNLLVGTSLDVEPDKTQFLIQKMHETIAEADKWLALPDLSKQPIYVTESAKFDSNGQFVEKHSGTLFVGSPYARVKVGDICNKEGNIELFKQHEEELRLLNIVSSLNNRGKPTNETYIKEMVLLDSPIMQYLTMGDICVNTDPYLTSTWDVCSYAIMMNHNVYIHFDNVIRGQQLYDLPLEEAKAAVPPELIEIKNIVEQVLKLPKDEAIEMIKKYKVQLRALSSSPDKNVGVSTIENSDLFQQNWTEYTGQKTRLPRVKRESEVKESTFSDLFA